MLPFFLDTSYSFGQGVYELKEGQVIDLVCKVVNPTTKPSIPILAWLPDHEHVANSSSLTVLFKTINGKQNHRCKLILFQGGGGGG